MLKFVILPKWIKKTSNPKNPRFFVRVMRKSSRSLVKSTGDFFSCKEMLHLIGLLSTASGFMLGKGTPFVTSTVDPPCPPVLSTVNLPNPVPSDLNKAFNAIEALLQLTVDPKATPAVSAGVMYKGKLIWSYGYGTVNKTAPAQVPNPDTIFRIGSISKIFPVLTLYQLIEQGKVASIDDPVTKYCSDFSIQNPFPGTDSTTPTWRQISSQISGCNN